MTMADVILPNIFRDGRGNVASGQQVMDNFNALLGPLNVERAARASGWRADDLVSLVREQLGLTDASVKRRGKTEITTTQALSSNVLSFLATPDVVSGIVLPTDGLIFVQYRALFRLTGASSAGGVSLALNGSTLRGGVPNAGGNPEETLPTNATFWSTAMSTAESLPGLRAGASPGADATFPGNLWGNSNGGWGLAGNHSWGTAVIEAPAGTYDVGIRWRSGATPGATVTVRDRKLWVWTIGF